MRKTDIEAIGDLAGEALAAFGTGIRDMHEGIAGRPFAALGPAAAPVREVHDGISRAVYAGVRGALRAASRGGGRAVALGADPDAPALASRPGGSVALAVLNGLYGNHLAARGSDLAVDVEIRRGGADADAGPRVVVFVHGLGETGRIVVAYAPRGEAMADRRTYGERLAEDLGFGSVYVRYNSGLHVSENGRSLSQLLDELVAPGRSLRGARPRRPLDGRPGGPSACHSGAAAGRAWVERFAMSAAWAPRTSAPPGEDRQRARLGAPPAARHARARARPERAQRRHQGPAVRRLVNEDWSGCDPDEFLRDRCQEVPFLPEANYYFIGSRLSEGPLGSALGDLLVRVPSASGRGSGTGRSVPFEIDKGRELVGLTHFDLLKHPDVYEEIRRWIAAAVRT